MGMSLIAFSPMASQAEDSQIPETIGLENIQISGDLQKRLERNFDRLESQRFQPIEDIGCLRDPRYSWPGDMEGRTILSLAMLQQAVDRDAVYLDETLAVLPSRMNNEGFFGENYAPACDEQQLSGHGWFLRGLCEYYLDTGDTEVRQMIEDVVDNLVLPTKGKHKFYPIDPNKRDKEHGSYSGTVVEDKGLWKLSSDIGCDFIFMDGVIQAAEVLNRKDLYPIIDEMIDKFLEIDLVAIKAQTHATLTALRGLIRYAKLVDRQDLVPEAEKRFKLYVEEASTENHMNYNWFGRPTHTEPCAFVDAFMVATQLWQITGNTSYLEEAHKIYFNGIGHAQRANGGFGLEECSGSENVYLQMQAPEAWWCCTMRGSEGLSRAAEYSYMAKDKNLILPFFNNGRIEFMKGIFDVSTDYPYEGEVRIKVVKTPGSGTSLSFYKPSWARAVKVLRNGKAVKVGEQDGFVHYAGGLKQGDEITYLFEQSPYFAFTHNKHTISGYRKVYQGPLLLAADINLKKVKKLELPGDASIIWNSESNTAGVKGRDLDLVPINDVIDWNYSVDSYCRQILWMY